MDNIIVLNDKSTYPKNILKDNDYNQDLDNYFIQCVSVSRVYDVSSILTNGLLRPYVVDKKTGNNYVSKMLEEIILKPYKNITSIDYESICKAYEDNIVHHYEKASGIEDYYGKYSVIAFNFDDYDTVNLIDSGYEHFKTQYGGELFDYDTANLVYNYTKPVAIFFKVKICDLPLFERRKLYNDMYCILNNIPLKVYPTSYIFKDISPEDIIEVKELKNYE